MLPGRKLGPEDLLRILLRRFWVLIVPFALVSAGTAAWVRRLPDVYRSTAMIQVIPQQVPATYVAPTMPSRVPQRLQAMNQKLLSRPSLEQLITELDLYRNERQAGGIMQNIVDRMRREIAVTPPGPGGVFRVSYIGGTPRTVAKVTEKLATMYINESLHDRAAQADVADQFLDQALAEAKQRLVDQETKIEAYRKKYAGQLPTQATANLQALANTQNQIQQLVQADNQDSDRRLTLERTLQELQTQPPADPEPATTGAGTPGTPDGPALRTTAQMLDAAKKALSNLQQKYSDAWPDVQAQKRYVDELQRKLDAEALQAPLSGAPAPPVASAQLAWQKRLKDLQSQVEAIDRRTAARQSEAQRLKTNAGILQQRIDAVPDRESELTELSRDIGTLTERYQSLSVKKQNAQAAATLEDRQMGEQFTLLDAARTPETPFRPNRHLYNIYGMAIGLAIGGALLILLEFRDSSFTTDDEVTSLLSLPVLAVVPLMRSEKDRRRDLWQKWTLRVGLGSAVAGCLAVLTYTFVR